MIDTQEPKNGDFARYVENLSRLPPGQGQVIGPRAPGSQSDEDAQPWREQLKALRKALEERKQQALAGAPDSLFGRAASGSGGAGKGGAERAEIASNARIALGKLAGGISTLLVLTGVVLIGLTLMDDVPWKPEFDTAVQFLVIGFVVRFVSRLLTAKA